MVPVACNHNLLTSYKELTHLLGFLRLAAVAALWGLHPQWLGVWSPFPPPPFPPARARGCQQCQVVPA
jgi:hypothetical protein